MKPLKNGVALLSLLLPGIASAICLVEPLAPQLREADVVYVGTVTASAYVDQLESLRQHKRPQRGKVSLTVSPRRIFKGDPAALAGVFSHAGYDDPGDNRLVSFAENSRVAVGDNLLVFGKNGEEVYVGFCADSNWDADTQKVVESVFTSSHIQ